MQRFNKYQYETSPRKLEPEYRTQQKKNILKNQLHLKINKQVKKRKNSKKEIILEKEIGQNWL